MRPERWSRVEQLFHSALKVEESQRPAFLEDTCGGDEDLRREVELLLVRTRKQKTSSSLPRRRWCAKLVKQIREVKRPRRILACRVRRFPTTAFWRSSEVVAWASCIRRKTTDWTVLWRSSFCPKRFLMTFRRLNSSSGRRARPPH